MKLARSIKSSQPKFKARVVMIDRQKKCIVCQRENFKITLSYNPASRDVALGQMIEIAYKSTGYVTGYVIVDTLMETVEAKVLEVQHIIAEGKMFSSVIFEDTATHRRMHSLVSNNNKLFKYSSILIKNDIVTIKLNNGELFQIVSVENLNRRY